MNAHRVSSLSLNAVRVPEDAYSGQTIVVSAPDGSGKKIHVVIPDDKGPGDEITLHYRDYGIDHEDVKKHHGVGHYIGEAALVAGIGFLGYEFYEHL